jgi:hypothetical protein
MSYELAMKSGGLVSTWNGNESHLLVALWEVGESIV